MKIAILGAGNLGSAIAQGLINGDFFDAYNIFATRNQLNRLSHLVDQGVKISNDNCLAVRESELIILAVKPYKILDLLQEIEHEINPNKHIIVSVATGIRCEEIAQAVPPTTPIFRAMPNTAIAIEESMTCICSKNANEEQTQLIQKVFAECGETLLIDEELMEAATVLGACGIAFVFRFIRAMIQGGIEIGFSAESASLIAQQTAKGAATLLMKGGLHPEQEIDKVTTPKGCTISGLNEMEHRGFSSSLIKGILNSYQKIER